MALSVGEKLGPYEIVSPIGKGGMGEVYRARDLRLGRKVAVKVLPAEFSSDRVRIQRFLREARIAASLTHPNIVSLFEIGEEDGVHFLAMEFLEGSTLRAQLNGVPMGLGRALHIGRQVSEALAVAHEAGIVHRDIKPENIFLLAGDHVKVLDFGLARRDAIGGGDADSGPGATETELTVAGHFMGTLRYMSAEQMRGKALDGRSDLFSLGIVLYEMMAGRHPFAAEVMVDSIQQLLTSQPAPLSTLNQRVPADVESIVLSCLEKDPGRRCPSASRLTAALAQAERRELSASWTIGESARAETFETVSLVLSSPPPLAPPSSASGVWIEWGRRWWPAAALPIVVIAGLAIWNAERGQAVHSLAILPFENASGDASLAYIAEGIPESIQRDLSGAGGLRVAPRSPPDAAGGPVADVRVLPANLKVDAALTGVLKRDNGVIQVAIRLIGKGGTSLWEQTYRRPAAELINLEEAISGDLAMHVQAQPARQKHAADARAYDLYLKGRHRMNVRTLDDLRQAILYFQQATSIAPDFALAWAGIGEAYALIANFGTEAPLASLAQAKAASLRALKLDATIPEAQTSYGFALAFSDHNLVEAERSLRKAIDLDPDLAEPHSYLAGAVLTPLKRFDEATIEIQRAIELAPGSSILRLVQINNLYMARRYDAALELLGKADPGFLPAEVGLEKALNLIASGRPTEAIEAIQAAVPDISVKWLRQGAGLDQTQLTLLATLAYARAQAGQTTEVDRLAEYLDRQARQTYVSQCDLAFIDISRRRTDGAIRRIDRCVADRAFESLFLQVDPRYDPIRLDPRFPGT